MDTVEADAVALHREALVWDMCIAWRHLGRSDHAPDLKRAMLSRLVTSGIDLQSLTVASDAMFTEEALLSVANEHRWWATEFPGKYAFVRRAEDVRRAKEAGQLAISFNFQGTVPIGRQIGLIEAFYTLGLRHMLLAYNTQNFVGSGCHEESDDGLSRFGVEVVREMNRVGMLIDLTHCGIRTSLHAMEMSASPVIFSHSNARALHDHARNITDAQIIACARTGGVIGINGVGIFLGGNDVTVEAVLDHIDHVARLVGWSHVGVGLDYVYNPAVMHGVRSRDNAAYFPSGQGYELGPELLFLPPEIWPEITAGLLRRGYPENQVRGILGENFLRVASEVWQ